ncbi:MAG: hypothetical protein KGN01_06535 [Patescibacteria group bacterium]|nr:hypothetical protein [Patescibacteria group bacterium]
MKLFETSDLSLASALAMGIRVEGLKRNNPRRVSFLFIDENDALNEFAAKFYNGQLRVDPNRYFRALRTLKKMIYDYEKQENVFSRQNGSVQEVEKTFSHDSTNEEEE